MKPNPLALRGKSEYDEGSSREQKIWINFKEVIDMALEKFLGKVSELTQTGIAKGKELTDAGKAKAKELKEIGKLKMENASEQEAIKKSYLEIGRLYFAEHGENPDEAYAGLCEKIAAAKAKIEYNLERIADIKAAGDLEDEEIETECCCEADEAACEADEAACEADEAACEGDCDKAE